MFVFRRADLSDVNTIAEFNCRLAWESEAKELHPATVQRGVRRGLQLAPEVQYFLAVSGDTTAGQLMLTREWSDWRDGWMLWLQSVYVDQNFRSQGVFRQLFTYAIQTASAESEVAGIRLYVEHANTAAIATYSRLGFSAAGYEVMEMPFQRS